MQRVVVSFFGSALRREIRLNTSVTTVETLKSFLPDPKCELLYHGSIMADKQPLAFYNLADGEMIVSFAGTHRNMNEIESFMENMRIRMNPALRREEMRLRDLMFMRFSRKEERNYYKFLQADQPSKKWPTFIDEQTYASPREDPLPIFF
ncbi:hypothetical protein TRFO_12474 [Tritrichomonas foetus]|uniref:Ubiquitin-like domain-containing protein n=1 Tax=Tritrichomonas foetus TaxID=1144522 RepID=A0A1J4L2K4_9EUKA|nr:hypothetical protein TRFO_12474 [Tritrichomonas foetus]|eukprot:OHT17320.1 hypothetical protein TRFO_12474 [Tritrichomonas foetus]